jgi:hypothetical protein
MVIRATIDRKNEKTHSYNTRTKRMQVKNLDDVLSTLAHKVRDKEIKEISKLVRGVQKDSCDHWRYGSSRYEMKQMLKKVWFLNEKLENYGMWVDVDFD